MLSIILMHSKYTHTLNAEAPNGRLMIWTMMMNARSSLALWIIRYGGWRAQRTSFTISRMRPKSTKKPNHPKMIDANCMVTDELGISWFCIPMNAPHSTFRTEGKKEENNYCL